MNLLEKQHRIYEAAEEDPVYRIWRDQYLRYRKAFLPHERNKALRKAFFRRACFLGIIPRSQLRGRSF